MLYRLASLVRSRKLASFVRNPMTWGTSPWGRDSPPLEFCKPVDISLLRRAAESRLCQGSRSLHCRDSSVTDHNESTKEHATIGERVDNDENTTVQLTGFSDATTVVSGSGEDVMESDLMLLANPMPNQGLGPVLSRMYEIRKFFWTSLSPRGTTLSTLKFPKDLFDVINISRQLKMFSYFRCKGVKVQVRINSTARHYGALAISDVPGVLVGSQTTAGGNFQSFNNNPVVVFASESTTVELDYPWVVPMPLISLPLTTQYQSVLERVSVDVLAPLMCAANSISPVSVTIYASFIEPELFGPNPLSALPTSKQGKGSKVPRIDTQEQESKSESHSMLSDFSDYVDSAISIVDSVSDAVSKLAPLAALMDKPTLLDAPAKVRQSYSMGIAQTEGADDVHPFTLNADAKVAMDVNTGGDDDPSQPILEIMSKPGYARYFVADSTMASETLLDHWLVTPMMCYGRLYDTVGSHTMTPTYQAYYSNVARYWRGAIRYTFVIVSSQFVSSRLRFTFVPNYYTSPPADIYPYSGDMYSKVIDVRGESIITIEVPFIFDKYWAETGNLFGVTNAQRESTGTFMVHLENALSKADGSEPTQYVDVSVFQHAGPDYQLAGVFGWGDPAQTTTVLEATATSYLNPEEDKVMRFTESPYRIESRVNQADCVTSVTALLKRYSRSDTSPDGSGYLDLPNPPPIGTTKYMSLFNYLQLPFRFTRGAVRYRLYLKNSIPTTVSRYARGYSSGENGGFWNGGALLEVGPNGLMMSAEVPFYSTLPAYFRERFDSGGNTMGPVFREFIVKTSITMANADHQLIAAGDDYYPSVVRAPPEFVYTVPP